MPNNSNRPKSSKKSKIPKHSKITKNTEITKNSKILSETELTISSRLPEFYMKSVKDRQEIIGHLYKLSFKETQILENLGYFQKNQLDTYSENIIGQYSLPLGIATNFTVNDQDYLIPMVTEEPSIIAAASNAAKIARIHGGFQVSPLNSLMIGQIQIIHPKNKVSLLNFLQNQIPDMIQIANSCDEQLLRLGGGAKEVQIKQISSSRGEMIIIHVIIDVKDAMGANIVNTMVERIAEYLLTFSQFTAEINLKIVSNLAIYRTAACKAIFDCEALGGEAIVERILDAYEFACNDIFRATTHNKGILNGIDALAIATGNDFRAIEAGAHAFAAREGHYLPLSQFTRDSEGNLCGFLELPVPFGIIGGIISSHPMAQLSLKILNIKTATQLSQIAVALGLAQNVAALRALASEGIQKGHMKLHARKTKG